MDVDIVPSSCDEYEDNDIEMEDAMQVPVCIPSKIVIKSLTTQQMRLATPKDRRFMLDIHSLQRHYPHIPIRLFSHATFENAVARLLKEFQRELRELDLPHVAKYVAQLYRKKRRGLTDDANLMHHFPKLNPFYLPRFSKHLVFHGPDLYILATQTKQGRSHFNKIKGVDTTLSLNPRITGNMFWTYLRYKYQHVARISVIDDFVDLSHSQCSDGTTLPHYLDFQVMPADVQVDIRKKLDHFKCLFQKHEFSLSDVLCVPFGIRWKQKGGHHYIVSIHRSERVIRVFDPAGASPYASDKDTHQYYMAYIIRFFVHLDLEFLRGFAIQDVVHSCPMVGIQEFTPLGFVDELDPEGYCTTWSWFYIDYAMYSNQYSVQELLRELDIHLLGQNQAPSRKALGQELVRFIRDYYVSVFHLLQQHHISF